MKDNQLSEFESEQPTKNINSIYRLIIGTVLVLVGFYLPQSYWAYAMIIWGTYRMITAIRKTTAS
jgi:hypothetical protein